MSISCKENNYYWFKSALTPKQCNKILEAGMSELVKKSSAYGTEAIKRDHKLLMEKKKVVCLIKVKKQVTFYKANMTKEKMIRNIKESDGYVRDSSIA